MDKKHQLLAKALRENGFSTTKTRVSIFELLLNQPPQSMHELIARANGTVDRVSVYRIVELFEKLGIVQRLTIGWKYKIELTDIFLDHHHHLHCTQCGKVTAVKNHAAIEALIQKIGEHYNYSLTSHQLEMHGVCSQCRANESILEP